MAIKKAFQPLHTLLESMAQNTTLASIMADPKVIKLFEAGKGGFNGTDSFVTVDGTKVGRVCAMLGAVFAHDNTDKTLSFFYKNGSYMIGAEVVKANARKEWDIERNERLEALEDSMLEGDINPKEWKEQDSKIKVVDGDDEEFTQAKAEFATAYTADEVAPFTDYSEAVEALRDLAPKKETEEA